MNQTPAPHRAQPASSDQNGHSDDNPIALDTVAMRSYEPYYLLFTLNAMIEREGKITPANWNDAIERAQAFKSERAGHLDLGQS